MKVKWHKTDERPEKDGNYLCIPKRSKGPTVLHYSKKHDGFNCFGSLEDKKCEIKVRYWMELPELPKEMKK